MTEQFGDFKEHFILYGFATWLRQSVPSPRTAASVAACPCTARDPGLWQSRPFHAHHSLRDKLVDMWPDVASSHSKTHKGLFFVIELTLDVHDQKSHQSHVLLKWSYFCLHNSSHFLKIVKYCNWSQQALENDICSSNSRFMLDY